jgi:DNA-binding LacI/PurR family transcriptional regulator
MIRVSMRDIGAAVGVSRSTVSRALSGDPQIPADTAARVHAAAQALGYHRDPAFDVLARQRWSKPPAQFRATLGFLVHADVHQDGYLRGARGCAADLGYQVDAFNLAEYPTAGALQRVLIARGISGLIVPIFNRRFPAPNLNWSRFAVVACSVDSERPPFHVVRTNVIRKVEIAWAQCRARGYRRIAVILPHASVNELDHRRIATANLCVASMPESERIPVWANGFEAVPQIDEWLQRYCPDAVIAGQPAVIHKLRAMAHAGGRLIPHCCLIEMEDCACVLSRPERIGFVALSILHQQLVENNFGPPDDPFTVVIEPGWKDGASF